MKIRIEDNLFLRIRDTSFGTLSKKIAFAQKLQAFKIDHQRDFDRITPREIEVLSLLAQGNNNPETADLLGISRRTVENHRKRINRKLGIGHPRDLIIFAMAFDLIPKNRNRQTE